MPGYEVHPRDSVLPVYMQSPYQTRYNNKAFYSYKMCVSLANYPLF